MQDPEDTHVIEPVQSVEDAVGEPGDAGPTQITEPLDRGAGSREHLQAVDDLLHTFHERVDQVLTDLAVVVTGIVHVRHRTR